MRVVSVDLEDNFECASNIQMFDAHSKLSSRSTDTTRVNFLSRQVDGITVS